MKRVVKFNENEEAYSFTEENKEIFAIEKSNLQFDSKKFYDAFFKDDLDYKNIELENECGGDKTASRIFDVVENLVKAIIERLELELPDEIENGARIISGLYGAE